MLQYPVDAHGRHDAEPDQHDRSEAPADAGGPQWLKSKQTEQDEDRSVEHPWRQAWRHLLHAFERRENRYGGRDRAIAVDQGCTEHTCRHDDRAILLLHAEQRHQGQNSTLPVIVDAHGDVDIFDGGDDEERPKDQRDRS